jgi:hypothetical protein
MDDPMQKIVVLVPQKLGRENISEFFDTVADAVYEMQDKYQNRDWDIFVYCTPEDDDYYKVSKENDLVIEQRTNEKY